MSKKIKSTASLILIFAMVMAIMPVVGYAASTTRYEAEDASYGNTYTKKTNNYASGGYYLSVPTSSAYCEVINVDGGNGGSATLNIASAAPNDNYKMHLYVNGKYYNGTADASQLSLGFSTWTSFRVTSVTIVLNPGKTNTIKLARETGDSSVNLDYFEVVLSAGPFAPVASGVSLMGKPVVGEVMTGSYSTYTDADGDIESGSVYRWSRADDSDFVTNVTEIKSGTIKAGELSTYQLTEADVGKYIGFTIIPKNDAVEADTGMECFYKFPEPIRMPQTKPMVSILSPSNGTKLSVGEDVTFTASATCDNATITKVEYYSGTAMIGSATIQPYTYLWNNLQEGTYSIVARAYNDIGEQTDSEVVNFIVTENEPIKMSSLFANDMVLQRNKDVKIYGSALDSEGSVTVKFNGQQVSAPVKQGNFMATLAPMEAGGPYTLEVTGDKSGYTKTFTNVMVGEVWVCSGQSNMNVNMSAIDDSSNERKKANYPNIRLFSQTIKAPADYRAEDVLNGQWKVCTPSTVASFSAVAYFFGQKIHIEEDVPVGLLWSAVGGTSISWWMDQETAQSDPDILNYFNTIKESERYKYYYGKIAPMQPYTIGGAIWYQGESDAHASKPYEKLLTAMIKNWRDDWGQGDFPFLIVQLPNYNYTTSHRSAVTIREAQLNVSYRVPNTGTAITMDVGNNSNIHPTNKKPVGERLALQALHLWHPDDDMIYTGPLYKSMEVSGDKIILKFNQTGTGLKTTDDALPLNFTICGEDKTFVDATAQITDTDTIEVSSPDVATPVAVRYAWSDTPAVNLVNSEGLPASPFRTDDFSLATNRSPIAEITTPSKGATFDKGETISIKADAFDYDGTVAKVEFYANEVKIGEDTTAPYEYTWSNVPSGEYALQAIAIDNNGATTKVNGSTRATLRPFTIQVGRTKPEITTIIDADFEDYFGNDGIEKPSDLTTVDPKTGLIYGAESPDKDASRSLQLYTNTNTEGPVITAPSFTCNTGSYVFETEILCDSYNASRVIGAFRKNGESADTEILTFDIDGYIKLNQPVTRPIMKYALNTWYKIRIEANTHTNRVRVWINGNTIQDDTSISYIDSITGMTVKHTPVTSEPVSTYIESLNVYTQIMVEDTTEPELSCTILPFKDSNDKIINTLNGQTNVTASASVENFDQEKHNVVMIVALYSGNQLVNTYMVYPSDSDKTDLPNDPLTLSQPVDLTKFPDVNLLKVFVWEDADNLIPLTEFKQLK